MAEENEEETKKEDSTDKDIIEDCRDALRIQLDLEDMEREKMRDDLLFCTLDQWPKEIRNDREDVNQEGGPRPCLTIDKINQYIVQVVNDMRQGRPGINIRPMDDAADVQTAKILKGIIRNIEDQSKADIAYATAGESAAKIGLGYIRVVTQYVSEDSFDQEIRIVSVPNTFSCILGEHIMPDGSDSKKGWVIEQIPVETFKQENPGKKWKEDEFDDIGDDISYWRTDETVTVVEYYYIKRVLQTLYFLADGTTMSEADYNKWPESAGPKPAMVKKRDSFKEQLKWCKMTGVEVLEKRDLPGKYIPIIEVIGRESHVDGKRILWGLVRPAKDSLRMYNYFASTITERMGLAPLSPVIGAVGQFSTAGDRWKKSNKVKYAYLEYDAIEVNGNQVPAPARSPASPVEAALLQQMQVIEHDVQTSLGMFKAATGESESQQSGRAILALQRESDTGTYHFGANQGVSIRHVGHVVLDMIPHYYDTKRVERILGDDGEVQTVQLDPEQEMSHRQIPQADGSIQSIYNPGVGKYDVAVTVGPSYNTKRMEDQAIFVEMAKGASDPASAAAMRYLVVRNSDNPGAQEAARIFKALLPPQALQAIESKEPIPPQVQAEFAKMHAQMQQMMEEGQKLQQENMQLKAGVQTEAMKIEAKKAADHESNLLKAADAHDEHARAINDAMREDQRLRWEARLKAATAVEVANINSDAALGTASIKAETDAATALSDALIGADTEVTKAGIAADTTKETEAKKAEATKAAGPGKPLEKIAALHQEGQKMHAQSMEKIAAVLEHLAKPKTVTATSSSGAKLTAQVH